jgi:hypothetical protein
MTNSFGGDHFIVKCHNCGTVYAIQRSTGYRQEAFLRLGPRCTNTEGVQDRTYGKGAYHGNVKRGQLCGALLGRGMWSRSTNVYVVEPDSLLGLVVGRPEDMVVEKTVEVEKVVERVVDTEETAALRAEVARLQEKYETPCKGIVKTYGPDGIHYDIAHCGGYMGHPGDCALVW